MHQALDVRFFLFPLHSFIHRSLCLRNGRASDCLMQGVELQWDHGQCDVKAIRKQHLLVDMFNEVRVASVRRAVEKTGVCRTIRQARQPSRITKRTSTVFFFFFEFHFRARWGTMPYVALHYVRSFSSVLPLLLQSTASSNKGVP